MRAADAQAQRHLSRPRAPRDGMVRYVSHRRLRDYPLFVAYGVPESEVLAPSRHRARIFFAGAGAGQPVHRRLRRAADPLLSRRERRVAEMARANRAAAARRSGSARSATGITIFAPARRSGRRSCCRCTSATELGSPTFEEFKSYPRRGRARGASTAPMPTRSGPARPRRSNMRSGCRAAAKSYHWSAVIPVLDAAGNVVRLHGTDQNISARKQLDLLQTHVAHLSRVEAMNAMAATLAHELNQPLTVGLQLSGRQPAAAEGGRPRRARRGRGGHGRGRAAGPSRRRHHPPGARDGRPTGRGPSSRCRCRGSSTTRSR